jgi:hypothetical protein
VPTGKPVLNGNDLSHIPHIEKYLLPKLGSLMKCGSLIKKKYAEAGAG